MSRYADVEHVFKNPTFSTDMYEWMIEPAHGPTLLSKHGAEHSRYRNLVAPFFRGAILESDFMPMIEAQARSMIDRWHADGSCDLVEGLSRYLPIKVIVAMLGLPDEDHPKFQEWYESINRFVSNINQDADIIAEGERTRVEFQEYLMPVIAERRRNPGDDLLSNLVTAEIDGSGLSDIEVKSFTSLLLTAGGETTDKAIASLFKNLLEHPDQLEQVRSDRSLVTMAVAETLRYSPPAHWIQRLPHEEAGLAFVHQDLQDVGDLSAAENVVMGLGYPRRFGLFVDWAELRRQAAGSIARLEADIDPRRPVGKLSVAQQRLVMIARGLAQQAQLLVLDEPSASLTDEEIEHLYAVVRRLRDDGITVVYVSHRLEEIFELTERVLVMRNGLLVADEPTASLDRGSLISHITGHEHAQTATERRASRGVGGRPDTEVVLEVDGVSADTGVHNCSFDVRQGEILGLGGLMGSGRTELVRAVFGADHRREGMVRVHGVEISDNRPSGSMSAGLALLPEDRKTQGNIMDFSVRSNITLASLDRHRVRPRAPVPSPRSEKQVADARIDRLSIATPSDRQLVRLLSGGNQQKVVIAK